MHAPTKAAPPVKAQTLADTDEELEMSAWPYLSAFVFPVALLAGVCAGGLWTWLGVAFAFGVMPLVELVGPTDSYNPSKKQCKALEDQLTFRVITWLYAPMPAVMVGVCAWLVSVRAYSWFELAGIAASSAIVTGGIGITVAHELMHKQSAFEQFLSKFMLIFTGYMHFFIEHLHGHHKRVATEEDPATSRLGESLYAFVPRSVYGSFVSAWHLETARLARVHGPGHTWTYRNQMLWFVAIPAAVAACIYGCFGAGALAYFVVQAVLGFSLLEVVNYIEHYGLQRDMMHAGRYERVSPLHSWNADHVFSNYVLFKLQRHADHHTWPTRRYQTLRTWEFSPKMPTGYAGMMLVALVPPLWRRLVDPMVAKYNRVHARRVAQLDSYVLEPRAGESEEAVAAVECGAAEAQTPDTPAALATKAAAPATPAAAAPASAGVDVNVLLSGTSTLLAAAYASAPHEYIDPFLAAIPASIRDAYRQFSPSSAAFAHYFPSLSLEWLYALLSERQARLVRAVLRYTAVRTAQLLIMLGSALAWAGLQLGGRGGALLLVRFGMHVCHLAESMLFDGRKGKGEPFRAACYPRADNTSPRRGESDLSDADLTGHAADVWMRRTRSSPSFLVGEPEPKASLGAFAADDAIACQ